MLCANKIKVETPAYILHYGTGAHFTSECFVASFCVWEKRHGPLAMSEVIVADLKIADKDPEYQVETVHYEYATILEMLDTLEMLKNRLLSVQSDSGLDCNEQAPVPA